MLLSKLVRVSPLTLVGALLALGCGGTEPAPTTHCADIVNACHEVDPGSGPLHDCHEIGHDGDETMCGQAVADGCVTMCAAAPRVDGGMHMHGEDGGMHMHGEDGGMHMHGEDGGAHMHGEDGGAHMHGEDGGAHMHGEDGGPAG